MSVLANATPSTLNCPYFTAYWQPISIVTVSFDSFWLSVTVFHLSFWHMLMSSEMSSERTERMWPFVLEPPCYHLNPYSSRQKTYVIYGNIMGLEPLESEFSQHHYLCMILPQGSHDARSECRLQMALMVGLR